MYSYYIPAPNAVLSDWITTDPFELDHALSFKNGINNSMIKPLIRLVKYWNERNE